MTWCPGLPKLIPNRLVVDGGWIAREGVTCFNLYRPPRIELGDATKAAPWTDHVHRVFDAPGDAAISSIGWLTACSVPSEKINHALLLGGEQGIGKDTMLEPIKHAVGPWNFHEITPANLSGNFNGYVKSIVLRINEARDLGEANRFDFYDHIKIYAAAPPDVLRANEKYLREHYVFNVLGLILTTNHKTDGIYLPAEDRRHYVAWSNHTKEEFSPQYWQELWGWYYAGGFEHVAAYLTELDLSDFRPEGAAAEDRGVLGHRQRQLRTGRCRARRRARCAGQPRRRDAGSAACEGDWRGSRMADGSKKSPVNSTPSRPLRLHLGAQSGDQRRTMEGAGQKTSCLCQGQSELARPDGSSESAIGMMLPA